MLLLLAGDAAQDRQWQTAYNIASHLDDVLPVGADISHQPIGIRDDYTSLAWLAGNIALDRMNRPASAVAMFDRYARAGHSLQVQTKGYYWAGRAALPPAVPGSQQLFPARRRLSRVVLRPARAGAARPLGDAAAPSAAAICDDPAQRAAFNSRPLVQAVRLLGQQGRSTEQALFVKALAESLDNDSDRNLAVELGQQIGRQDLPVWIARMARVKGSMFYVRQAYPTLPASVSATCGRSPTASAGRKAPSILMRSATPARAA